MACHSSIRRAHVWDRRRERRCTIPYPPAPCVAFLRKKRVVNFCLLFSFGHMSLFLFSGTHLIAQRFLLPKKRIGERRPTWTLTGVSCLLSQASTSSAGPWPETTVGKMPPMFTGGTPLFSPRIIFPPALPDLVRLTDSTFGRIRVERRLPHGTLLRTEFLP